MLADKVEEVVQDVVINALLTYPGNNLLTSDLVLTQRDKLRHVRPGLPRADRAFQNGNELIELRRPRSEAVSLGTELSQLLLPMLKEVRNIGYVTQDYSTLAYARNTVFTV